jgi:hypothetical protein
MSNIIFVRQVYFDSKFYFFIFYSYHERDFSKNGVKDRKSFIEINSSNKNIDLCINKFLSMLTVLLNYYIGFVMPKKLDLV